MRNRDVEPAWNSAAKEKKTPRVDAAFPLTWRSGRARTPSASVGIYSATSRSVAGLADGEHDGARPNQTVVDSRVEPAWHRRPRRFIDGALVAAAMRRDPRGFVVLPSETLVVWLALVGAFLLAGVLARQSPSPESDAQIIACIEGWEACQQIADLSQDVAHQCMAQLESMAVVMDPARIQVRR